MKSSEHQQLRNRALVLEVLCLTCILTTLICVFIFHTIQYKDRPNVTALEIKYEEPLSFPALTVCSVWGVPFSVVSCRAATSSGSELTACTTDLSIPAYLKEPYDDWLCKTYNYGLWEAAYGVSEMWGLTFQMNSTSHEVGQYLGLQVVLHHDGQRFAGNALPHLRAEPDTMWLAPSGMYTQFNLRKTVLSDYGGSTVVRYDAFPSSAVVRPRAVTEPLDFVDVSFKFSTNGTQYYSEYSWKTSLEHVATFATWWCIFFGYAVHMSVRTHLLPYVLNKWNVYFPLNADSVARKELKRLRRIRAGISNPTEEELDDFYANDDGGGDDGGGRGSEGVEAAVDVASVEDEGGEPRERKRNKRREIAHVR
eukprot:Rmarinus@m.20120